jgi:hypothetical protein
MLAHLYHPAVQHDQEANSISYSVTRSSSVIHGSKAEETHHEQWLQDYTTSADTRL